MSLHLIHESREANYYKSTYGFVFVEYKTNRISNSICHVSNDEDGINYINNVLKPMFRKMGNTKRIRRHYRCPMSGIYNEKGRFSRRGNVIKSRAKVIDIRF